MNISGQEYIFELDNFVIKELKHIIYNVFQNNLHTMQKVQPEIEKIIRQEENIKVIDEKTALMSAHKATLSIIINILRALTEDILCPVQVIK